MVVTEKTHEVLTWPVAGAKPKIWEYTPEQLLKIQGLRSYAETLLLPTTDPYYPNERKWLLEDAGCIARYIRASKWRLEEGKKRILETIKWRREWKPDLIAAEDVRIECETGKIVLNGFDLEGRPIIYMRPGLENTETSVRQIRHLIFCLERAIDFMPPGQETMAIIIDYKTASLRSSPSISQGLKVLNILQQHYVERLGRGIIVNLPTLLSFFYKAIAPFLDPVTREKMWFNPDTLLDLVPAEQLDADFEGGQFPYEFEPTSYWEQICRHAGVRDDGTRYPRGTDPNVKLEVEAIAEPDVTPAVDPRDALHAAELLTAAADPQDT